MKTKIMFLGVILVLSSCTTQKVAKKPPLVPYDKKTWIEVNSTDFIPPNAKTYIKIEEIDLEQVVTEQPTEQVK